MAGFAGVSYERSAAGKRVLCCDVIEYSGKFREIFRAKHFGNVVGEADRRDRGKRILGRAALLKPSVKDVPERFVKDVMELDSSNAVWVRSHRVRNSECRSQTDVFDFL